MDADALSIDVDGWEGPLDRFKELAGTEDVSAIKRATVNVYLADVAQLPSRPKKAIGDLSLREQITAAHAAKLPTLSPPTIGKHLTAIRSLLAIAAEDWIVVNPAAGLSVEGAKYTGTERDYLSDEDMHRIYTSPLMTDPDACSDTMFWILLLAPFQGSRPGEHCKLKPREIVRDDGAWVMRFRVDRRPPPGRMRTRRRRPRRQKTEQSVRDVPIHWIVIEAGFLDWVNLQIERGEEWVFGDLVPDRYGDRYKYLSREINDAIRALGIVEADKAFYSTRHSMKREGRRTRMGEHELDQLTGHASATIGRKYGRGSPMATLKEGIDQLEFRSVQWDGVVPCAHRRIARLAEQVTGNHRRA